MKYLAIVIAEVSRMHRYRAYVSGWGGGGGGSGRRRIAIRPLARSKSYSHVNGMAGAVQRVQQAEVEGCLVPTK